MPQLPWRWYCRICGDKDNAPSKEARDEMAEAHLRLTDCGGRPNIGRAEQRRLLHVWTY